VHRTNKQAAFLLTSFVALAKEEVRMGKLPLIVAVASVMWALPAFAEDGGNPIPSKPAVTLAQLDLCIGLDCRRERERVGDTVTTMIGDIDGETIVAM
jgi:hypothetical protein